jgi:flagellin
MSSINTNVSAMTALQTLAQTNKNLATTQSRISTGFRVAEASDNAAYWSIATTMRSDNKALSTVQDALGLGAGKVDVAYTGMNAAIEVVDEIKQKLIAARGASADDRAKIDAEIGTLQDQLESTARSASFSGTNFLANASTGADQIVASFSRDASGSISVGTMEVNSTTNMRLFVLNDTTGAIEAGGLLNTDFTDADAPATTSVFNLVTTGMTDDQMDALISGVDDVLSSMTTAASDLGAVKKRVDLQTNFVSNLMDAIDRGVGQLVDADMSKESARLSALQTQQQLGIQALSIANSNSQNILSLFR